MQSFCDTHSDFHIEKTDVYIVLYLLYTKFNAMILAVTYIVNVGTWYQQCTISNWSTLDFWVAHVTKVV